MSDKELEEKTEEWRKFYGILEGTTLSAGFGDLEDNLHVGMHVQFLHPNYGYPGDQDLAKRYLHVGTVYTVERWHKGGWQTTLELKGFPGHFNSVLFEEYKPGK